SGRFAAGVRACRRRAFGLAAVGSWGAAGLRLASLRLSGDGSTGAAAAAGPAGSWVSPLGDSRALAAHLLRRAAFGYSDAELDAVSATSYPDLVVQLIDQKPDVPAPPQDTANYQAVSQWWYQHMATTHAQFHE